MTRCAGLRVIACALVVLAAAVCRPARAAETVSFGITSTVAFSLAHYIAAEKQFYAAENLRVDTFVVGAAAGVLHQLAAGSLNVAQAATDQSLRAILHGAPIRIVAGAAANAPFRLIAARTIRALAISKAKPSASAAPPT